MTRSTSEKDPPSVKHGGFRLDGKTAIVTGGGSGIGRALGVRVADNGEKIHILDLSLKDAEGTCQQIGAAGGSAEAHVCDVTDQKQVNIKFQQLAAQGPISILVNNAGISHIGTVESTSEEDFDRVMRVNVKGFYNCARAVVSHMKNSGGVILNMASIAGSSGLADRFAYSVSKGAILAMTYSVARDYLAYNIRCNCISPARVYTPLVEGYLQDNSS